MNPPVRRVVGCNDGGRACPFFSWNPHAYVAAGEARLDVRWTPNDPESAILLQDKGSEKVYRIEGFTLQWKAPDPIGQCGAGSGGGYRCWRVPEPSRVPAPEWCPLREGAVTVRLAESP